MLMCVPNRGPGDRINSFNCLSVFELDVDEWMAQTVRKTTNDLRQCSLFASARVAGDVFWQVGKFLAVLLKESPEAHSDTLLSAFRMMTGVTNSHQSSHLKATTANTRVL